MRDLWDEYTATPDEQAALKAHWESGGKIEAKGRGHLIESLRGRDLPFASVYQDYTWGVVKNPKWDFKNNYYRKSLK